MLDKWKTKRELYKAYKFYKKKKIPYLRTSTIDTYEQLQDIQYAIAYVLCEYFDFNYEFYYDNFLSSYKWDIAYDYIYNYEKCKEVYENIIKQNKTTEYNYIAWSTNDFTKSCYVKGNIICNMENGCLYFYDGENFKNMC